MQSSFKVHEAHSKTRLLRAVQDRLKGTIRSTSKGEPYLSIGYTFCVYYEPSECLITVFGYGVVSTGPQVWRFRSDDLDRLEYFIRKGLNLLERRRASKGWRSATAATAGVRTA